MKRTLAYGSLLLLLAGCGADTAGTTGANQDDAARQLAEYKAKNEELTRQLSAKQPTTAATQPPAPGPVTKPTPVRRPPPKPKVAPEIEKARNAVTGWVSSKQAFAPATYPLGGIPEGQYLYIPSGTNHYYSEEDTNGNIIDNEGFSSFGYVHVHGVGNVKTLGFLIKIATVKQSEYKTGKKLYEILKGIENYNFSGYYLVGSDIPAGSYRLTSVGEAYFSVESGPVGKTEIVQNDNFSGSVDVRVSSGQYLKLTRAKFKRQ